MAGTGSASFEGLNLLAKEFYLTIESETYYRSDIDSSLRYFGYLEVLPVMFLSFPGGILFVFASKKVTL